MSSAVLTTPTPPNPSIPPRPPGLWKDNVRMGLMTVVAATAPHVAVGIYRWLTKG